MAFLRMGKSALPGAIMWTPRQAVPVCKSFAACCAEARSTSVMKTRARLATNDACLMSVPPPVLIGTRAPLRERPPLAVLPLDEPPGLGRIAGVQRGGIPFQL